MPDDSGEFRLAEISLEMVEGHAYFGMAFSDFRGHRTKCATSLRVESVLRLSADFSFDVFGVDLARFREQLWHCYKELRGCACLQDCDAAMILSISAFGTRGQFAFGGRFFEYRADTALTSSENFRNKRDGAVGLEVLFEGLQTDQTEIHHILRDLDALLSVGRINTANPYTWEG